MAAAIATTIMPPAALLLLPAATGGVIVAVEFPPGLVGDPPFPPFPPVTGTVVSTGSVQGVVGTGDRVTISGVVDTCLQASQTTVVAESVAKAP